MNADDCEDLKFVSPADKFGGDKKLPACVPLSDRDPEVLKSPDGEIPTPPQLRTPLPLIVGNPLVRMECAEGSYGPDVVVPANLFTEEVELAILDGITDGTLNHIAVNALEEWLLQSIYNEVEEEEISTQTTLTLRQIRKLTAQVMGIRSQLKNTAELVALGQLSCYWLNEVQTAECDDPAMAKPEDHSDALFTATVAAGQIKSFVSQALANFEARLMAEEMLHCFYVSDAQSVDCTTRPDNPREEAVPTDIYPVTPDVPLRVGSWNVRPGQFISTVSKAEANAHALNFAINQLRCLYFSDPLHRECDDPSARALGEDPKLTLPTAAQLSPPVRGQIISVPRGYIVSRESTASANQELELMVYSLLECCFISEPVEMECPPFALKYPSGQPVLDENNKPIFIPASATQSPQWSAFIPAGAYNSCDSQEAANELAQLAATGLLQCLYCNTVVLPTCVPTWVIQAIKDGILQPDGSVYSLPLPLELDNLINPFTGQLEDTTMWSKDATVGAAQDTFCSIDYVQSQQIAESVGSTVVTNRQKGAEECEHTNRRIIVACAALDPYNPEDLTLDHEGTLPSGEPYRFVSKYAFDACISKNSRPKPGEVVEIQTGTMNVTTQEVPGALAPDDPLYDKDYNDLLAKKYADQLAITMALSLLNCEYANPLTHGICEVETSPAADEDLCVEKWIIGRAQDTFGLSFRSNWEQNPLVIAPGTIRSTVSLEEVYRQTTDFVNANLFCEYCNVTVRFDCPEGTESVSPAIVQQGTFCSDTFAGAQANASSMASSMQACMPPGMAGPPGPPGADGKDGKCTGGACSGNCYGIYS